jgi:hypothetical protein
VPICNRERFEVVCSIRTVPFQRTRGFGARNKFGNAVSEVCTFLAVPAASICIVSSHIPVVPHISGIQHQLPACFLASYHAVVPRSNTASINCFPSRYSSCACAQKIRNGYIIGVKICLVEGTQAIKFTRRSCRPDIWCKLGCNYVSHGEVALCIVDCPINKRLYVFFADEVYFWLPERLHRDCHYSL